MYEVNFDRTEGRNSNKITVGDFDTPLSVTDRTTRQKISKETEGLDNGAVVVAVQLLSHVQLYDPMGCSPAAPSIHGILQANWSGLPFSFPGDLPKSGIKPMSSALADGFFTANPPGKPKGIRAFCNVQVRNDCSMEVWQSEVVKTGPT